MRDEQRSIDSCDAVPGFFLGVPMFPNGMRARLPVNKGIKIDLWVQNAKEKGWGIYTRGPRAVAVMGSGCVGVSEEGRRPQ
mmetsp:Transcript_3792/g.8778  ORF Transcript_3792/g.8778 Transcript_3792/m.8778 type:complete len:81 (+) Transcript_3792:606-848(+)